MGAPNRMRIGLDFDNTIVCYDGIFHKVALEQGLIPEELPVSKDKVRDHLRVTGREAAWTLMQGSVYGERMREAAAFPGVLDFLRMARASGSEVCIISHRTRVPFLGPEYDLHAAATRWMEEHGFFDPECGGLSRDMVYLELTRDAKLKRIAEMGCHLFMDDLPEVLAEPCFPEGVERFLFSTGVDCPPDSRFTAVQSWPEFENLIRLRLASHAA